VILYTNARSYSHALASEVPNNGYERFNHLPDRQSNRRQGRTRIVKASVQLADQFKPDTDLAGRWTLERARQEIPDLWIPNCRRFVTLGIFRRTGGSRGGKRGYYQLVDIDAVKKALVDRGCKMIGIDARKKNLLIAGAIAWYFIAYNGGVAQIGPFATQAACSNYAASI
jgi:hypothetical protein